MLNKFLIVFVALALLQGNVYAQKKKEKEYKIQIALLLDVSGSMDGLITQAKGQVWNMVNELSRVEKKGKKPVIEMALGAYGGSGYEENGYFQSLAPLTTDMDLVSEKLFDLFAGGGNEYCGYALQYAIDSLHWSKNKEDLKIIFIAGNEMFNQGSVDYTRPCKKAVKKEIYISTIYCGPEENGVMELWKNAAEMAEGKYAAIQADTALKNAETFWDKKIIDYNQKINTTYIPFGSEGRQKMKRQTRQDENAEMMGNYFIRDRVIFKTSENYFNPEWDLVDAYEGDTSIVMRIDTTGLPEIMHTMSTKNRIAYIERKKRERQVYFEGVKMYYDKAKDMLRIEKGKEMEIPTLQNVLLSIIHEEGKKKNFSFK